MTDSAAMRDFTNISHVLSRMSKLCVLRISPDQICFSVSVERMPIVWIQVKQSHFFREYMMCGISAEQNEILLELDAMMFSQSLSSLRLTAKSVKIKLTNKQQPCLTFEIDLSSIGNETRKCTHDLPVRVIPRKEWSEHEAPNIPEFDISIDLPQLRQVRKVVERMRNMSPHLIVTADRAGNMSLKVDNDNATVTTHFQGLQVWNSSQSDQEEFSTNVDVKKFYMFVSWDHVHLQHIKCNILHDRMLNLSLCFDEYFTIEYFVPAITI